MIAHARAPVAGQLLPLVHQLEPRGRGRAGTSRPTILLAVAMLLAVGCIGPTRGLDLSPGDPAGEALATLVDSEPARRLLVDLLAWRGADQRIAALTSPSETTGSHGGASQDYGRTLDQARLRELGLRVSVDYAALTFARDLGADERSRAAQAAFARALRDGSSRSQDVLRRPGAFPWTVLFVPGWLYRSEPDNGADFAHQRRLLSQIGIANRLIETPESGAVEDNAAVIAAAVRAAAPEDGDLILVSTSKAGAEVALALSRVLAPEDARRVVGWVNAGGALRGTPLVDRALRPPASWFTNLVLWITGWDPAGLTSMTTARSRARLEGARLPDWITVVNLVAVPVSGTVTSRLYGSYQVLLEYGPNDGLVMLADTVWSGGVNVVALGADHLLVDFRDDAHALALLRVVADTVRQHAGPRPSPCPDGKSPLRGADRIACAPPAQAEVPEHRGGRPRVTPAAQDSSASSEASVIPSKRNVDR